MKGGAATARAATAGGPAASMTETEQEYAELLKRYRIMEGDRKAYSEEAQQTIRKQRTTIEKLRDENEQLQRSLNVESQQTASFENAQVAQQLARLADQKDKFEQKLSAEKQRAGELDAQIRLLTQRVAEERLKLGGANAESEHDRQLSKQIKILENRLQKSMVRFNGLLTDNRTLREEIDKLRRERQVFDAQYGRLERQLQERKQAMSEIIEMSNNAYQARDDAQRRIAETRERQAREQQEFEAKLRELQQQIATDKRNKDFLQLMQGRSQRAVAGDDKKRKDAERSKIQSQVSLERVAGYEEAFRKIQEATGIEDPNEFVTQFIKVEDQNFSLFNYVNELNTEIERLEEQISETNSEIERYRTEGASTDMQRKQQLRELEQKLQATEEKAAQYDGKYQQYAGLLSALKASIQDIFVRIGCDAASISEGLGNQGVTDHNLMVYLAVIEQRTNDLLGMYRAIALQEGSTLPVAGPHAPLGASMVAPAELPSTADDLGASAFAGDGSDDEDAAGDEDDDRPLTRDELKRSMRLSQSGTGVELMRRSADMSRLGTASAGASARLNLSSSGTAAASAAARSRAQSSSGQRP